MQNIQEVYKTPDFKKTCSCPGATSHCSQNVGECSLGFVTRGATVKMLKESSCKLQHYDLILDSTARELVSGEDCERRFPSQNYYQGKVTHLQHQGAFCPKHQAQVGHWNERHQNPNFGSTT